MPNTSHAAERAPQQATKPATLSQLGELVSLMDKGKVERDYMQDFLRRRLTRQSVVAQAEPAAEISLLGKVEEIAREYYPDAVNEILEVVAPWCHPHLNMEFQEFKGRYDKPNCEHRSYYIYPEETTETEEVHQALFWLGLGSIQPLFLGKGYEELRMDLPGKSFETLTRGMFAEEFKTFRHIDPGFDEGATKIVHGQGHLDEYVLENHIDKALMATGAIRYGLIQPFRTEHAGVLRSITRALHHAIVLASKGDKHRLPKVLRFLQHQRSGRPVCHYHEGVAYVLGLKNTR